MTKPYSSGANRHAVANPGSNRTISSRSVYHTHVKSADLIKQLQQNGWELRGVKGSHHVFTHPTRGGHISVPHPKKDLGTGLVEKLLKQAGLK